jgi:hypothetical protein
MYFTDAKFRLDDVPYHAPPEESPPRRLTSKCCNVSHRLTLQHFDEVGHSLNLTAPHNSDARRPDDTSEWPPDLIFDFFYGCAAVKAWGRNLFIMRVRKSVTDRYHDNADPEVPDVGELGDDTSHTRRIREQADARNERADFRKRKRLSQVASNPAESGLDDMMDVVMTLWTRLTRKGHRIARH